MSPTPRNPIDHFYNNMKAFQETTYKKFLIDKVEDKSKVEQIKKGLEDKTINTKNFDATQRRLKQLIGEE